jgi:hypothetical protein
MKIKRYSRIEWDDLSRIETPFFAADEITYRFPRTRWSFCEIRDMDKARAECGFPGPTPADDYRKERDWFLKRIEDGEFVLVHDGEWEFPMSSVLRWSTENHPDGFRIPSPDDRIAWLKLPSEGHWVADFRLPILLRSRIEQCLEAGRRDELRHRGLPERLWWNLWQQGRGESGGPSASAKQWDGLWAQAVPAACALAVRHGPVRQTAKTLWSFDHPRQPDEFGCSIRLGISRWIVGRFF